MDDDRKTPDQKFSGAEFEKLLTDYHNWGFFVLFLESPLQGGKTGLTKW